MNDSKLINLLLELVIKYKKIPVLHTEPFNLIGSVKHNAGGSSTPNENHLVHRLTSPTYQFLLGRAIIVEKVHEFETNVSFIFGNSLLLTFHMTCLRPQD